LSHYYGNFCSLHDDRWNYIIPHRRGSLSWGENRNPTRTIAGRYIYRGGERKLLFPTRELNIDFGGVDNCDKFDIPLLEKIGGKLEIKKPQRLSEMIGQDKIRESLAILITVARERGEALDHVLFIGSHGLGKTTFANIVAYEMGVNIKEISGSIVEKVGDLAAILTNLRAGDILLVEQIESLRKPVIEVLNSSAEDFSLDIVIGRGASSRKIKLKLPRFTIIGTNARFSKAEERLRSCTTFFEFTPYDKAELGRIIMLQAKEQNIVMDINSANLLAEYCNGNAGEASFLLEKVYKHALAFADGNISPKIIMETMKAYNRKS
jgi:holliday junction DNA helicase RuvB